LLLLGSSQITIPNRINVTQPHSGIRLPSSMIKVTTPEQARE
jgi:hypothetical protein